MPVFFCQWKPFCIPVGDNFQKAYLEEWSHIGDDSTGDPGENSIKAISTANVSTMYVVRKTKIAPSGTKKPMDAPSAPRPLGQPDAPTWELLGPQGAASFWEKTEAPLPHQNVGTIFYSPEAAQSFS